MTASLAAGLTLGAFGAAWAVAQRTAAGRGASIGRFPLAAAVAVAVFAALTAPSADDPGATVAVDAVVAVAAFVDARTGAIYDSLTAMLAATCVLLALGNGQLFGALAGACVEGGLLLGLHVATRGRGIGLGDVKLGAATGAGLGAAVGIVALGAAFVAGGGYGAWLLATRRAPRGATLPFGPFVALGTAAATALPGAGAW